MAPSPLDGDAPAAGGGSSVGIIYPPPEVRNIVDKTATFVARNGPEFEQRIKQHEVNNPKFNFLNPGDPYHAYYQHRVVEIRDGKPEAPVPEKASSAASGQVQKEKIGSQASDVVKQRQSELLKQAQKEVEPPPPKDPPPEFEFIAEPPSISAFDLDVVKLTAQFVARNGRQFLTNLMNREQRNYQFDFLRPQHSLFQYFTKLLEQYTKVLIPPKDMLHRLEKEGRSEKIVLDAVDYRVRWIKHQEAKRRREEEEAERERVSYAQIDWHTFVVVETVDYQQWEVGNFPPPTSAEEVGARVLMQRRVETNPPPPPTQKKKDVSEDVSNTQVEDMDEDSSSDDDDDDEPSVPPKPVDAAPAVMAPPTLGNVEVRKYDPKQKAAAKVVKGSEAEFVSPLTGETIPANKVQEHMRIGLLDPRWVEERDKQITARATEDAVFAPGQSIENSLKHLAERRTDIFGVGEEAVQEADIGKKMGEEETAAEAAIAASSAEASQSAINEQLEQMRRTRQQEEAQAAAQAARVPPPVAAPPPRPVAPPVVPAPPPVQVIPVAPPPQQFFMPQQQNFGPPGGMMPPQMGGVPPMGHAPPPQARPPPVAAPVQDDEPPNKRPRGEDHLIPEEIFLARSPAPEVTFIVMVPHLGDKPEWNCSGQQVPLTLPLTDPVSVIKSRMHEETGMPPGKQKLQLDALFLKDGNSLAYYNLRQGGVISLQVKERGGRKK